MLGWGRIRILRGIYRMFRGIFEYMGYSDFYEFSGIRNIFGIMNILANFRESGILLKFRILWGIFRDFEEFGIFLES